MPVRLPCAARITLLVRSVEPGGIHRAGEVGEEHPIACDVERDADALHQVGEDDLRGRSARVSRRSRLD